MKTYWPIFFGICIIFFQLYLSLWQTGAAQGKSQDSKQAITMSPTSSPTPTMNGNGSCLQIWEYPKAQKIFQESSIVMLESTDPFGTIVSWYQQTFSNTSYTTTSTTRDENNTLASQTLMGSNSSSTVSVEITQSLIKEKVFIRVEEVPCN